jgi:hypothetical protein
MAFIDIYSENEIEHQKVLQRLYEAGLQAIINNFEFRVTISGISTDGIEVDPEKTVAISDWKKPTTVRQVQSFLGFRNHQRFIEDTVESKKIFFFFIFSICTENIDFFLNTEYTTALLHTHIGIKDVCALRLRLICVQHRRYFGTNDNL